MKGIEYLKPGECPAILSRNVDELGDYDIVAVFPDDMAEAERLMDMMNATFPDGMGPFIAVHLSHVRCYPLELTKRRPV